MATDDELLNHIQAFFSEPSDFNGISLNNLASIAGESLPELRQALARLVALRKVDLAFASHSGNPHIKRVADLPPAIETPARTTGHRPSTQLSRKAPADQNAC